MAKNDVRWKDVVVVDGQYHYFDIEVDFESDVPDVEFPYDEKGILKILGDINPIYDCGKFFDAVAKKFGENEAYEFKSVMFDGLDFPKEEQERLGVDYAWLGGYINGVNI